MLEIVGDEEDKNVCIWRIYSIYTKSDRNFNHIPLLIHSYALVQCCYWFSIVVLCHCEREREREKSIEVCRGFVEGDDEEVNSHWLSSTTHSLCPCPSCPGYIGRYFSHHAEVMDSETRRTPRPVLITIHTYCPHILPIPVAAAWYRLYYNIWRA